MIKLIYLGHSAFIIESADGKIAIDPFITGNPNSPVSKDDIEVEYVLLSHGHGDHLGDGIDIALSNDATIIAPFELATFCGDRGAKFHPMHIGGSHEFSFGRVKLTIAHHGSAFVDDTGIHYTGNPCGFLITMGEKILYHTGDTGLFYDMKLIGEMNNIDVAMIPIGDNFTMGIEDAVKAVEFLKPGLAIPMHYRTFDVIMVDPGEFVEKVREKGYEAHVLEFGGTFEI